jgi:hypothetical protein
MQKKKILTVYVKNNLLVHEKKKKIDCV